MVELCQKIAETNQDQEKEISEVVSQIKMLTEILASNITKSPLY